MFFKFVNSKSKIKNAVMRLRIGDEVIEDDREIAEELNRNFKSVFTEEGDFIEPESGLTSLNKLMEIKFSKLELVARLRELDPNKSMGPDRVSGWILKECAEEVSEPIYEIIKASLDEGLVPLEWKKAHIVAIYKGSKRERPLNYRPVSLLNVLAKVCERIVRASR